MISTATPEEDCFYTVNGRILENLSGVPPDAVVRKHYRLRGGKGGFGSMLRAIGSQIEKTTNHEMCRDLSGRRMRDVNMEKKLKEWYAKASDREREKMEKYYERRMKRQEMLAKGPLPGHKFSDREYERQKRKIAYELQGALDEAIAKVIKEKSLDDAHQPSTSSKRPRLWIEELDGDSYSSSSTNASENGSPVRMVPEMDDQQAEERERTDPDHPIRSESEIPEHPSDPPVTGSAQSPAPCQSAEKPKEKPPVQSLTDSQLIEIQSVEILESFGLDVLKQSLISRGLKCGGTLSERATRLFSIRGLAPDEYPARIKAKSK
ncbi:unnamed protein product [Dicrocoelium dendriticum]|nr:unnamed protein product [Dicrocoelium dendriticum]